MTPLFPTEAVETLTSIVNNGQVLSRRREIGGAVATLIAWLFSAMYTAGREAVDEITDEAVGKMEDLLHSLHTAETHFSRHQVCCSRYAVGADEPGRTGIDPASIAAIITLIQTLAPMVLNFLDWLRERRKQRVNA